MPINLDLEKDIIYVNVISETYDKEIFFCFIHVSQAFDKMWHEELFFKINQYLSGTTHNLLESYLTNRKFVLKKETYKSLPQGNRLLYLIYTLANKCRYMGFTCIDICWWYTAILGVHENPQEAFKVQNHIHEFEHDKKQCKIKLIRSL